MRREKRVSGCAEVWAEWAEESDGWRVLVHLVLPSKESSGATNRVQSNTGTTGVLVRAQIAERGGVGPSCASCLTEEERTSALDRGKPITFRNKRKSFPDRRIY